MRTSAIVLAGGAASRFGGDKLAAELRGRPVLHHALLAVDAVIDGVVVVVLGPADAEPSWPEGLRAAPVVARDPVAYRGPLAGIAAGLAALGTLGRTSDDDLALVVAGDMPSLVPDVLGALVEVVAGDESLAAAWLEAEPIAPLPLTVRPARVTGVVAELLAKERRSLRALLDAVTGTALPASVWRALDPDARTLVDIDTHGDLDRT